MKYKKWSLSDKLSILQEAEENGAIETCRKHSLSTGTFYSWKKKFDSQGESGLMPAVSDKSKELKKAEEENKILRKLLSDKEIELEVQRELLKKKFGTSDPKKIW
ncbi:transposase [Myroides marinus]|uniref:Putative transposase n=1 Tax=Myroides phaeus TaxID=702745 RepID=A0A1G8HBA7_9FLAO|nr:MULTISPECIES: transposase [Myroides]MDM1391155.1 transposase [Myroides marinus]SDI03948.1 putative transposase [Myroides phaeus]